MRQPSSFDPAAETCHAVTPSVLSDDSTTAPPESQGRTALERTVRPLLRLAGLISGAESTFLTAIDWDTQSQEVLYSLNRGRLEIQEGSIVDWQDSMCRSLFLSGLPQTSAVGIDVVATSGAIALGMKSFFAFPILAGETTIGTVCGASKETIALSASQLESMQLIADALQQLLEVEVDYKQMVLRAELAEREAEDARTGMVHHERHARHMEHLAHTDSLTGLPNRRAFFARWEDELARSGRRHYQIGLMLIDADRFKSVNDAAGHAMGDDVLRAIGKALVSVARSPDVVARLGGDEFAFVTTHADSAQLYRLASTIRAEFSRLAAKLGVDTTLSIGMVSSEHCRREQMLADADKALYRAKDAGGDTARLFGEEIAGELRKTASGR